VRAWIRTQGFLFCIVPLTWVAAATEDSAPDSTPSDANTVQPEELERIFTYASAAKESYPDSLFDPAALQDSLGIDAAQLIEWVKQNTDWVPYSGVLKGAAGTLVARQGNSADRALLAVSLLTHAGHDARVAWTTTPVELMPVLLEHALHTLAKPGLPYSVTPGSNAAAPSLDHTDTEQKLVELVEKARATSTDARESSVVLTESLTAQLGDVLGDSLPDTTGSQDERLRAALRKHFWVQLKNPTTDRWDDIELFMPDAMPWQAEVPHEVSKGLQMPAELLHTATLEFGLETAGDLDGTDAQSHLLLQHLFTAAGRGFFEASLQFVAPAASSVADIAERAKSDGIKKVWQQEAETLDTRVPVLDIPLDSPVVQRGVTRDGKIVENGLDPITGNTLGQIQALDDVAGGLSSETITVIKITLSSAAFLVGAVAYDQLGS